MIPCLTNGFRPGTWVDEWQGAFGIHTNASLADLTVCHVYVQFNVLPYQGSTYHLQIPLAFIIVSDISLILLIGGDADWWLTDTYRQLKAQSINLQSCYLLSCRQKLLVSKLLCTLYCIIVFVLYRIWPLIKHFFQLIDKFYLKFWICLYLLGHWKKLGWYWSPARIQLSMLASVISFSFM